MSRWAGWGPALCAVALVVALPFAAQADFVRDFTFEAEELQVGDLIGRVEVRGHPGSEFRVQVHVHGEDATEQRLEFEQKTGRVAELWVQFPLEESRRYVYPELGMSGRSQFRLDDEDDSGWLGRFLGGEQIEVRGRDFRGALELWADITVEVPKGKRLAILLGAGRIEAEDVNGDVDLDTHTGAIEVDRITGRVNADTGSGSVSVRDVQGDVDADTGSGSVSIVDIRAASSVRIDTGSGSVAALNIAARELNVDTGSGSVDVEGAVVENLTIDTGSGGVDAVGIETNDIEIDTGSGGVRCELVRMGTGRYHVDTGSGGIRLQVPRDVSAMFDVGTGSGGIDIDIAGVDLSPRERREDEVHFKAGDGASRVQLSTGSGTVRVHQGRGQ